MRKISVVGTGYVGLVTAACLADLGHRVTCIDIDKAKIASLQVGLIPIYEPGVEGLVQRNMTGHRLFFTASFKEGLHGAELVFTCVGTPATHDNKIDLSFLHLACLQISNAISGPSPIIVNKSTVPPGTGNMLRFILSRRANGKGAPPFVANPEFLREGQAVFDFMHPSRVVIGSQDREAAEVIADLYRPLGSPILLTDVATAEMIKYASNAFLATKISFINEIAALCERLGTNVDDVAQGIGLDPRIGKGHLKAGIGYGGSCLPKDIGGLLQIGRTYGEELPLIRAVTKVNTQQPQRLLRQLKDTLGDLQGVPIAVLGVTFKPHTDDVRSSPAIEVIKTLLSEGAHVLVYDPKGYTKASSLLPKTVQWANDPYDAAQGCRALVIATDWPEFRELDYHQLKLIMAGNVIADGRNCLNRQQVEGMGFRYLAVGRGAAHAIASDTFSGAPIHSA